MHDPGSRTVLVTGGCGYIGSHACVELAAAGWDVAVLDNLCNSSEGVLDRVGEVCGARPRLHLCDLLDREGLGAALAAERPAAVLHFAGLKSVAGSVADPLSYWRANVGGTLNLLGAMEGAGCRALVFSSSATVYGEPSALPIPEGAPLGEPASPYGATKAAVERILSAAQRAGGWSFALLRYFNPVGAHPSALIGEDPAGEPANLMPLLCRAAAGGAPLGVYGGDWPTPDGTGVRDYVHVVDLARGHVAALEAVLGMRAAPAPAGGGPYVWNLGTGRGVSVLELADAFARANGVEVPLEVLPRRSGDVAAAWADPSRALRDLGWRAELGLEDMCRDAWRWQRARAAMGGDDA